MGYPIQDQFETIASLDFQIDDFKKGEHGEYLDSDVQSMWIGFKAAMNSLANPESIAPSSGRLNLERLAALMTGFAKPDRPQGNDYKAALNNLNVAFSTIDFFDAEGTDGPSPYDCLVSKPLGYAPYRLVDRMVRGDLGAISCIDRPEDGHDVPVYLKLERYGRTEWVDCPVCGEPDMEKTRHEHDATFIRCANLNCVSNGGDNMSGLTAPGGVEKSEGPSRVAQQLSEHQSRVTELTEALEKLVHGDDHDLTKNLNEAQDLLLTKPDQS